MPRKYIRNNRVVRGQWTEENLVLAIEKVKKGEISKTEAQRQYGIPIRTLSRRLRTGNTKKSGLGPEASLGAENEKHLACYIKRMTSAGFAPGRKTIRSLAYQFAEKLGIKHKFSKETEMAGQHWLTSFLERNKDIIVGQAEVLSIPRAKAMNREEGSAFFKFLEEDMIKIELTNIPENIFNVNESGVQFINKPGEVLIDKEAIDPTTFRETECSSVDPTPSTSKDTIHFIEVQGLPTSNLITIPANKVNPTKIPEIANPIAKLSTSTVKTEQFACVLPSPDNVNKKTANPKLTKRASKQCKLVGVSASLQQNASNPIEDDNNVCTECWEYYFLTNEDYWIKCSSCEKWLHESCTMHSPYCNVCGTEILRQKRNRKR